jgi:hypothetical protein
VKYIVTLFTPDPHAPAWNAAQSDATRTLSGAERVADTMLEPHARAETSYSARANRGAYVNIETAAGRVVRTIEAPVRIVPSVGDLGWTP